MERDTEGRTNRKANTITKKKVNEVRNEGGGGKEVREKRKCEGRE